MDRDPRFELGAHGKAFATRRTAGRLREAASAEVVDGRLVVDFEGVQAISGSFADEFAARLVVAVGSAGRVVFLNVEPGVADVLAMVFDRRHLAPEVRVLAAAR